MLRLSENPFNVLKASLDSTRRDLADLAVDAELDGHRDERRIGDATNELMRPRRRLVAELNWLPGMGQAEIDATMTALATRHEAKILSASEPAEGLARANIAADLLATSDPGTSISTADCLLSAWLEVNDEHLLGQLNRHRQRSGFGEITADRLAEELATVRRSHAATAARFIHQQEHPGRELENLVAGELDADCDSTFLGLLVGEYDRASEPKLLPILDQIDAALAIAKSADNRLDGAIDKLGELLIQWDEINQPVQLYLQSVGQEEVRSRDILQKIRSLMINLSNEHDRYDASIRLGDLLVKTFSKLDSAIQTIRDDMTTLQLLAEKQQAAARIKVLVDAANAGKNDPSALRRGFSQRNGENVDLSGTAQNFVQALLSAARGGAPGDTVFGIARELGLYLHNERNDTDTASQIAEIALAEARRQGDQEWTARLTVDVQQLRRQPKLKQLEAAKDDPAQLVRLIDELLPDTDDDLRRQLAGLRNSVARSLYARDSTRRSPGSTLRNPPEGRLNESPPQQKSKSGAGRLFWLCAALIVVIVVVMQNSASSVRVGAQPTFNLFPSAMTAPTPVVSNTEGSGAEVKPPPGNANLLSLGEVRYCIFERHRLEAIRFLIEENNHSIWFDQNIADFNGRCGDYRYYEDDLRRVNAEAANRDFAPEAQARIAKW